MLEKSKIVTQIVNKILEKISEYLDIQNNFCKNTQFFSLCSTVQLHTIKV